MSYQLPGGAGHPWRLPVRYNHNHDSKTGEFDSGDGGAGAAPLSWGQPTATTHDAQTGRGEYVVQGMSVAGNPTYAPDKVDEWETSFRNHGSSFPATLGFNDTVDEAKQLAQDHADGKPIKMPS